MEIEKRKRGRPSETEMEVKKHRRSTQMSKTGSNFLDRVREEIIKAYTPPKIREMVDDLCTAEDQKENRQGGMIIRTPNWKAREAGLKTLLSLAGLENGERTQGSIAPTHITVNVMGEQRVEIKDEPNSSEFRQATKEQILEVKPIENPTE